MMDNINTNELIEQYLSGTLPPAELEAVESRIATDADFRAEVEWHGQMHDALADPKKLQLRDMLSDILREPPPPPPSGYGWRKRLGFAMAILIAGGMGWYWLAATRTSTPAQEVPEEMNTKPTEPMATPDPKVEPTEPIEKAPKRPIAMADPKALAANPEFEDRLGSRTRGTSIPATISSPSQGAHFVPENGMVKINFKGTAPSDGDDAPYPLVLKIFSNTSPSDQPLLLLKPEISSKSRATENWSFSSFQRLHLQPGLYYFTIAPQSEEDIYFTGKFIVDVQR